MANPFATGYREPQAQNNYLKFKDEGSYVVRILTPKNEVLTYFTCFTDENKKIILEDKGDGLVPTKPEDAKEAPKLVWAVAVYNVDIKKVQVWEIPQSSIRQFLFSTASGKIKNDWTKFDLQITKTGQGMETNYSLIADDSRELTKEEKDIIANTPVNLSAMEKGEDPFAVSSVPDEVLDGVETKMPF